MAVDSALMFRRFAHIGRLVGMAGLLTGAAALAQLPIKAPAPVSAGSIIPFHHGATGQWGQVYSMRIAPNGNILFLDSALSEIFQLAPGASTPTLVVGPADKNSDCSDLEASGTYWNAAIAFDQWSNLYVTDRYGSAVQFCRVPYNASTGTWKFSSADIWNNVKYNNQNVPPQDMTVGDDGTFYVSTSSTSSIYKFNVDQSGNVTNVTPLATGLQTTVTTVAVDHAGNVFFLENIYGTTPGTRVNGIREIPVTATSPITGTGDGTAETQNTISITPPGAGWNGITGITFDAAGNLYFTSIDNTNYGGNVAGIFMIPNEGTPTKPNLVWADTVMVSPVYAGHPAMIDPRGYIWIATGGSGNWAPHGTASRTCTASQAAADDPTCSCDTTDSTTINATCTRSTIVLWKPGAGSIGTSPVGTAGTTQAVYYSFSQPTTFSSIGIANPGASNFTLTTNPNPDPATTPPVQPCTADTNYPAFSPVETTNNQYSWCTAYLQLNTKTAGNVEGELQLLDSSGNVIDGSNLYLTGIAQGSAVSVLGSVASQSLGSGLSTPKQVAADPSGNTYVADSGLKAVEMFSAGSTTGKALGSGLTAPTGVAVDGAGNVYIGDTGKVIEIPVINGALATSQQTTLATGLGSNLNLAADQAGDVFVADKDNKQIVEIPNPHTVLLLAGRPALKLATGANFTGPSAVATDNSGNLWVADGANLWQISMPFGGTTEVTSTLQAPITGLAVDPSGSVLVAGANGLIWIPYQTSATSAGLNVNGQVQVTSGLGANHDGLPIGVALDAANDIYVTYASSSTVGLAQLGIGGSLNFDEFGEVNPNVPFEVDAQLFNVGNVPLNVGALSGDTITGPGASVFSVGAATLNSPSCDPTSSTQPGNSCYLGLNIQDPTAEQTSASVAVLTDAANATAGVNIAMAANVIQDPRPASAVVVTVTPNSSGTGCAGSTYPGCVTVTVNVTSTAATPQGSVILSVPGSGTSQAKQTQNLDSNGSASFTLSALIGGTYNVNAVYTGFGTGGTTQDTCSPAGSACFAGSASKTTFTINPATPAFAVGPPGTQGCMSYTASGCTPDPNKVTVWAGNTYLQLAKGAIITATVTSKVGTPTGSVSFLVNGKPADPTQPQDQLDSNGIAYFSTTNLPLGPNGTPGVYNITAVYNGDVNYASQSITLPSFEVIVPSVQITSTPATVSTKAGSPVQATLTLMPLVGYSNNVALKCMTASLPQYSECTFAYPNSGSGNISVGSYTPSTIVVTISTNVPVNGGTTASLSRAASWSLAGLFGLGLFGLIAGRRRLNRYMMLVCLGVMLSGVLGGVSACTNAGYSTPPPAPKVSTPGGTYNVQVITYSQSSLVQTSLATPLFTLPVTVQ
ncbi:MAG TPA: Ig-like domain repeat protein [Terracidiphilus sp.]|nr:Ig-like domain repeat protein [Terracidiphilus sp.]